MKLKNIIPKKLDKTPAGDFWVLKRPAAHITAGEFYLEQFNGELRTVSYSVQARRFPTKAEAEKYRQYVKANDRQYLLDFEPTEVTITFRPENQQGQETFIAKVGAPNIGESEFLEFYACRNKRCCACSNITKLCGRWIIYGNDEHIRAGGIKTFKEAIEYHDKTVWCW